MGGAARPLWRHESRSPKFIRIMPKSKLPPVPINPSPENKPRRGRGNVWEPTPEQRWVALSLFGLGATQEQVGRQLGISKDTVQARLGEEFRTGYEWANLRLYQALFKNAIDGNVAAQIFLAKNRLGMSDRQEIQHSGDTPPIRAELSLHVTYIAPSDPRALAPPPADRLPSPDFKGPA